MSALHGWDWADAGSRACSNVHNIGPHLLGASGSTGPRALMQGLLVFIGTYLPSRRLLSCRAYQCDSCDMELKSQRRLADGMVQVRRGRSLGKRLSRGIRQRPQQQSGSESEGQGAAWLLWGRVKWQRGEPGAHCSLRAKRWQPRWWCGARLLLQMRTERPLGQQLPWMTLRLQPDSRGHDATSQVTDLLVSRGRSLLKFFYFAGASQFSCCSKTAGMHASCTYVT